VEGKALYREKRRKGKTGADFKGLEKTRHRLTHTDSSTTGKLKNKKDMLPMEAPSTKEKLSPRCVEERSKPQKVLKVEP